MQTPVVVNYVDFRAGPHPSIDGCAETPPIAHGAVPKKPMAGTDPAIVNRT
jgi:hypothetical protein